VLGRVTLIVTVAAAIAVHPSPPAPVAASVVRAVAYADDVVLDEYRPSHVMRDAPVIVLVHGCCGDRHDMSGLARWLARRGSVVLNADIEAVRDGGGWPEAYDDVVCAVGVARRVAGDLAGQPQVAVVAWSDGAFVASAAALGWPTIAATTTSCAEPVAAAGPDVVVGLGGYYGWSGPGVPEQVVTEATVRWFGTTPAEDMTPWLRGNPAWWTTRPQPRAPRFHLVAGPDDADDAIAFREHLVRAGVDAPPVVVTDAAHLALVQPRDENGVVAASAVGAALGLPARPPEG
jgi:dienelactone hydrolase